MKKIILLLFFLASLCLLFILFANQQFYWGTGLALILALFIINLIIKKHLIKFRKRYSIPFMSDNKRNYDVILLGDTFNKGDIEVEQTKQILNLTIRKSSLFLSYLFLIHNFSLLREDGNGCIYIKVSKNQSEKINALQAFCFHPVILMRLGINQNIIHKLPLLYYFKKITSERYFEKKVCLQEIIAKFATDRNINVRIIST